MTLSRRRFGGLVASATAAVVCGAVSVRQLTQGDEPAARVGGSASDPSRPRREGAPPIVAFDVRHGSEVYVWMSAGSPMTVRVHDAATGDVLERFDAVDPGAIIDIGSRHVDIVALAAAPAA